MTKTRSQSRSHNLKIVQKTILKKKTILNKKTNLKIKTTLDDEFVKRAMGVTVQLNRCSIQLNRNDFKPKIESKDVVHCSILLDRNYFKSQGES